MCSATGPPRSLRCSTRARRRSRAPSSAPAPQPDSLAERELVARFADAVQSGDVDDMVALLTGDALLTMPPLPLAYEGHAAIAAFLRYGEDRRGAPLRLVPTRAN